MQKDMFGVEVRPGDVIAYSKSTKYGGMLICRVLHVTDKSVRVLRTPSWGGKPSEVSLTKLESNGVIISRETLPNTLYDYLNKKGM